jgi:hypothetical protein
MVLAGGGLVAGDEITLTIDLELTKPGAGVAPAQAAEVSDGYYIHYYVADLYSCSYISLLYCTGVMIAHSVTFKGDVRVFALRMYPHQSVPYFLRDLEPVEM